MIRTMFFCCFIFLALIVVGGTPAHPSNQTVPIPDIIVSGLRDYGFNGSEAAIKTWMKGSALEGSLEASGYLDTLRQAESKYGKYIGSEQVRSYHLASNLSVFYLILYCERGPVFARFMAFRNRRAVKDDWIISEIIFQTSPELLVPLPGHRSDFMNDKR